MARQITLDGLIRGGINIYKADGELKVEANYQLLSGEEVIIHLSRDITDKLTPSQVTTLSNGYDAVFGHIEQMELG